MLRFVTGALVALFLYVPAQAQERECVTFEQGQNNLARMAKEADLRIAIMRLSAEDTQLFYDSLETRGLVRPNSARPDRVAFVVIDREPGIVIGFLYGADGCVLQNAPTMPAMLFYEIMVEIFGEGDIPDFSLVAYRVSA